MVGTTTSPPSYFVSLPTELDASFKCASPTLETEPAPGAAPVSLVKEDPDPVTREDLEKEFEAATTVNLDLQRVLPG